jgi:arylsulfatase
VYHKGWTAVTKHKTPWELVGGNTVAFDDDVWELYDTRVDWSQSHDLSSEQPERLHELQRLWLIEAVRYGVLPIDDRAAERLDPGNAGRPALITGNSQLLYGGMSRLTENSVVNIKNKSHSVTAEVEVPERGASGVIVAQGGSIGGWALYAHEGRLKYCYNLLGLRRFYVETNGGSEITSGQHQVRMEFNYDGGGLAKGGTVSLYLDGDKRGEGRVDATAAMIFSADDTLDVGEEGGSVVTEDYGHDNAFSGSVNWVQLDLSADDADHFVSDEERVRVAMARQ